ncbi:MULTISPECIES: TAXI family TRAP transporter solute-binding subunit [Rhodopseudomonas]|uniref:TAXI family TRAP transporter solute-binding subunit n=1 Tax=Rhodopseudomonas TaxID=1073 RepID=UPI0005C9E2A0|nr:MULTISPECIES: TAXI family TRAP transporter solute-binding subunit [Rhodopseudomonas]MDF3811444.1 TAXI family TRAP transporter solute-binding subunit [Rhodopseudomonas sp. BAL398]WOK16262.1 TAXI family TRAP transporter solute-binding subunit [Rhodopseudomonas sp. BAL398]
MEPMMQPPPHSAKRKTTFVVLAGTLALVGLISGAYYVAMRPVQLKIAVGPQNGDDAKVIQALTQAFGRDRDSVRLRPVLTDDAVASAAAFSAHKVDLAVIRGDLTVPKDARSVAVLHKNVAVLWVPGRPKPGLKTDAKTDVKTEPDAGETATEPAITNINQLAGHRVGVIGRTRANTDLLKVILRQYSIDPAKVEIIQYSPIGIAEAVRDHKVDAFIAAGPPNSRITSEAIAASVQNGIEPTFLAIDAAEAIATNHPAYEAAVVPAGAFGGSPVRPETDVKTISFSHHIVARADISDSTIATFTRQLFAARQSVIAEFPQAAKIETPDTDKDAVIPAHPGAAAYVDGEERTFLDRYSDYIWFSLIGLSTFGSVGAWFASYLRKDERIANISQRDRLLDMIAVARRCDDSDELDAMQTEADAILRSTLNCFENGAIEEAALTAFNIALEQFHNAVADRKMLLATIPPSPALNPHSQAV